MKNKIPTPMNTFKTIHNRAIKRKGGKEALNTLLPKAISPEALSSRTDSYFLEEMTRSIFQSGFVWRIINQKWPTFQQAFFDFELSRLMKLSDDEWNAYIKDTRIVRHHQKINAVRHNLWFVNETSSEHGGFGHFLAEWPRTDIVGLFRFLKTRGSRLGGNTGQYFLQHVGFDNFALTRDVVLCLQMHGLEISANPSSQKDLKLIQNTFDQFHEETGLPYRQLSMIMAYSVGENIVLPD